MNYLAHLLLSGNQEELMVGNFLGDQVKGKIPNKLPSMIAKGVELHRYIDSTADSHDLNLELKKLLYPHFGKFAGVALDMYHDHFLSIHWQRYADKPLNEFIRDSTQKLKEYEALFEPKLARLFKGLFEEGWMTNYASMEGIGRSMAGLSRRTHFDSGLQNGEQVLRNNYQRLETGFNAFFPEMQDLAAERLQKLLKTM